MKSVRMSKIPKCNFCAQPANYDAPTLGGAWAYMCKECSNRYSNTQLINMGTELVQRIMLPKVEGPVRLARRTSEEQCKCPNCGELRYIEPDAAYSFTCEGCGIKLKVLDCMEDTHWME